MMIIFIKTFLFTLLVCLEVYGENAINSKCGSYTCIRKCCPENHALINRTCVSTNTSFHLDVDFSYQLIVGYRCQENKDLVEPFTENFFYLTNTGDLHLVLENETKLTKKYYDYCVDFIDTFQYLSALLCGDIDKIETVSEYGMIISMPFLALTFLVYLVLPEKNLHRKALMFYVLSLLLGYIFLVSVQLHEGQVSNGICHLVGYCIIFFFLVSFFWMNVMCVDMFLAFSGVRGYNDKRNAERRRFIYYCIYAWGTPVLHIILVFLLNTYGDKQAIYHPLLGEKKCFLEDGYPNLFYFYLPMGILTGINIILFILTAVRIQKVKRETSVLKHSDSKRHSYEDDKQKFNLYLKLLFAMGINWTMEIISWAFLWKLKEVPTSVWYLTDFANALYGVFIFFIFVFKKKIWKSLKKRYYVFIGKPHLAHTMTTSSQSTRTSHFSTTDSGVNNDYRLNEVRNCRGEDRALNAN